MNGLAYELMDMTDEDRLERDLDYTESLYEIHHEFNDLIVDISDKY